MTCSCFLTSCFKKKGRQQLLTQMEADSGAAPTAMNWTELAGNTTSAMSPQLMVKLSVVLPLFLFFLCCIVVMLHVFASHREFLETSRYILFAFMLINDTLHIICSVLLFLFSMGKVKLALACCIPLLFVSSVTFQNTALILATMSLERYVAIFYPLQRPAAWRSDRTWVIILSVCVITCIYPMIDYFIGHTQSAIKDFAALVFCSVAVLSSSPIQILYRTTGSILFFVVVAIIILYTYMRILVETRKMRQDGASVNKAMHTVLLHGFQLLLCMLAFTHPITESLLVRHIAWNRGDIAFFNYFCFILMPRFLSPLIYGLRDQGLKGHIRKRFLCCSKAHRPRVRMKMQESQKD